MLGTPLARPPRFLGWFSLLNLGPACRVRVARAPGRIDRRNRCQEIPMPCQRASAADRVRFKTISKGNSPRGQTRRSQVPVVAVGCCPCKRLGGMIDATFLLSGIFRIIDAKIQQFYKTPIGHDQVNGSTIKVPILMASCPNQRGHSSMHMLRRGGTLLSYGASS
jgi:hypothetical protein